MDKHLKIVFALARGSIIPSGGFRVVAGYADRLAARGHEVTLIAPGKAAVEKMRFVQRLKSLLRPTITQRHRSETPFLRNKNVHTVILEENTILGPADFPKADVIIATWWETAEWINAVPDACAKIHFVQGHEVFAYVPLDRVRAALRLPMKKIVVSRWLQEVMSEEYGARDPVLIENVVEAEDFEPGGRAMPSQPTVGFVYSPLEEKNPSLAIDVCRKLKNEIPSLRVVAFGSVHPKPEHKFPNWIEFSRKPSPTALADIYRSATVWLFTSREEGFGLPVLEAMASGTPVVATPAGAAPDFVNAENGALVGHSEVEIAAAAERILSLQLAEWGKMSRAALATATRRNWEDATDEFEAVLLDATRPENRQNLLKTD